MRTLFLIILAAWLVALANASRIKPEDDCIRLFGIGDWGTPQVANTAKALAVDVQKPSAAGCKSRPASILMLGDNFYESGITSPDDELFKRYFLDNFHIPTFANMTFSVVAGNHDHRGLVSAQIAATSDQWYFPSMYYARTFRQGGVSVLVAFVDTWELIGGEAYLNGGNENIKDSAQLRWLENVLNTGSYDHKIVVGHYPIRSVRQDTKGLVNGLIPVLRNAGVGLYLHGHDHISQIIKRDGLVYVGSGIGGARESYGAIKDAKGLQWASDHTPGYVDISITKEEIVIDFHEVSDQICKVAFSYCIPSKRLAEKDDQVTLALFLKNRLRGDW